MPLRVCQPQMLHNGNGVLVPWDDTMCVFGSWDGWHDPWKFDVAEDGVVCADVPCDQAPATVVMYKFRGSGDTWLLDNDAPTACDQSGVLNNVCVLPSVVSVTVRNAWPHASSIAICGTFSRWRSLAVPPDATAFTLRLSPGVAHGCMTVTSADRACPLTRL